MLLPQQNRDINMNWRKGLWAICFVPCASVYAVANPLFSIIAQTTPTMQLSTSGQGSVTYLVTNNTQAGRRLTLVPVQGVTQVVGASNPCAMPAFTLQSKQSCLLTLSINGSLIPTSGLHSGPTVCKTKGSSADEPDSFFCSQASDANRLNITTVSKALHRVAVGVVTNTSSVKVPLAFVSEDGGATWSTPLIPLNSPVNATDNVINSVSCSSSGLICSAVGNTTIGGISLALSYQSTDGGLNWSLPYIPARPGTNTVNSLLSVSCSDSGMLCTAVGYTYKAPVIPVSYLIPLSYYSLDGGANWFLSLTLPGAIGTTNTKLFEVFCGSFKNRVGRYFSLTLN
jgi:hypothetical protein